MKKGDIFEVSGGWLLYMGDKVYVAHQGEPLLPIEVRLGKWTVCTQPVSLSSESELRRHKAICNIGRRMLLRLEKALSGDTRYYGPGFAESESLESESLYNAQIRRLGSIQAQIKRLKWRT